MTNTITYNNVHNLFKINGFHFKRNDLCSLAYSLIKEGEPYEKAMGDFLLDWFDAKSFLELNTSGTTGTPKTIKIEKEAMIRSALASGDFFDLKPGDKALHCLPTDFIAGKMMLVRAFILGLDIDFVAPSSRPLLHKDRTYDFVAMVPLQAQNSISELFKVKKMIVGGAKMNHELESQLAHLKTEVYETYGMTETITHIAAKRVGEEAFSLLPNIKISTDDRNCLVINAPNISNELIVTNDLVSLVDEDHFIYIGRIDNLINSGGIKLVPEKIEDKLSKKIRSRFFVAGIQDDDLGEKLVLIIEGEQQDLENSIFEKLDKYERPREIFYIQKFAETENGKIKRREILESL
jgi:O-succinylbenzoic acid--CoA ligase